MNPQTPKGIDLGSTVVLSVRTNWKVILGSLAGLVVGYVTMEFRLGRALTAAHEAKVASGEAKAICAKLDARLDSLATEREIQDVNTRVNDVVSLLSHAQQVAGEPPQRRKPK